jgi:hypothetical protein
MEKIYKESMPTKKVKKEQFEEEKEEVEKL